MQDWHCVRSKEFKHPENEVRAELSRRIHGCLGQRLIDAANFWYLMLSMLALVLVTRLLSSGRAQTLLQLKPVRYVEPRYIHAKP